nr:immunoglobulin light chain junction region [Macaca mulatta]
CQHSFDTPSSF